MNVSNVKQRITGSPDAAKKPAPLAIKLLKYNSPSMYDSSWEPYIAANLYMYAVPLAIFLRRARELDFSAGKFEKSIEIVKRVFRVFTPEVVDAISRYMESENNTALVRDHLEALGPFAPPTGPMSLSSLKDDMQSLLEEIDMQHTKKVGELNSLDRLVGRVEGVFGKGVVSGEEKTLGSLIDRAKLIARLPIDYEILPRTSSRGGISSSTPALVDEHSLRKANGELSDYAREQLLLGQIKCDPADVPYRGDKMRGNAGSHEVQWMVDLTVQASDWCNERLGLSKNDDGTFRINLRVFADYRNTVWFVIVAIILFKILF